MMTIIKDIYRYVNQFFKGHLDILKNTIMTYGRARASQAAAALAYYTIFSLFPLFLVIIAIGSFFLDGPMLYRELTQFIQAAIPVSSELISENLDQMLDARGTVGILGLLMLLWSASGMFSNLANNISLAWPKASRRNFLEIRLIGIGITIGISIFLILSFGAIGVTELFLKENGNGLSVSQNLWRVLSTIGSMIIIFFLFLALYRWIPTKDVHLKATFWGALVASVAWEVALWGFSWYLRSGLGRYQLVYGSLGAIVALLFLIYILSNITLFGAHLAAAIDRREKQNPLKP
ncbi:MAG: YihY/virulence factor BrkB family protein [Anaerolineales bacterium]|nr:YihY/virulence factor BrkB family protein [Anaerolineales bacterium]